MSETPSVSVPFITPPGETQGGGGTTPSPSGSFFITPPGETQGGGGQTPSPSGPFISPPGASGGSAVEPPTPSISPIVTPTDTPTPTSTLTPTPTPTPTPTLIPTPTPSPTRTYTVTAGATAGGTVTGNQSPYKEGAAVELIAQESPGHLFNFWTGDTQGFYPKSRIANFFIYENRNLTAQFFVIPPPRPEETPEPPTPGICSEPCVVEIKADTGAIKTALQAVDLSLLAVIDAKADEILRRIGPRIPGGGIAGKLMRFIEWTRIGRIFQVMTYITLLHNAYYLSSALTQTLFSAISIWLDVFGIEDEDGNPLDIGSIVGQYTENFFKTIFGVETVDGIKAQWRRFSRIYQAAANMLYSIQSMMFSALEAMEIINERTSLLGNALKVWGVVTERAFSWLNPYLDFQNPLFTRLQLASEWVDALEQVASEVKNVQDTGEQLQQQFDELQRQIIAPPEGQTQENQPLADQQNQSKEASESPAISPDDLDRPEG